MARMTGARRTRGSRYLSVVLTSLLAACNVRSGIAYSIDQPAAPATAVQPAEPTAEQLQQLVAPIELYPDELVAQVLAAATYPEQVVEADRWAEQHHDL